MRVAGIKPSDIPPVNTRDEALYVLVSIAMVARNNPLIRVVEELGELPPSTDIALTVDLVEAER